MADKRKTPNPKRAKVRARPQKAGDWNTGIYHNPRAPSATKPLQQVRQKMTMQSNPKSIEAQRSASVKAKKKKKY